MKILFVDDDTTSVEHFVNELEDDGHTVKTTSSLGEAIRHLEESKPELIVLDVKITSRKGMPPEVPDPFVAGISFYWNELQKNCPEIPVAFLTANFDKVPPELRKGKKCIAWDKVMVAGQLADFVRKWRLTW